VEEFQKMCEVQSDKATVEITSRYQGEIKQIYFKRGDTVDVCPHLPPYNQSMFPRPRAIPSPSAPGEHTAGDGS